MSIVRVAVAQTYTDRENPSRNVENAIGYVAQAAAQGAQILCLPETYPGPWTPPLDYDPVPDLCEAARENDIYIVAGLIRPVEGSNERYYNMELLISPEGVVAGEYRRTTPRGPWLYKGSSFWDFDWQEHNELPVFDTPWCRVGLLICSEVYMPELSRILALKGAELIFLPAGIPKEELWPTWRTLIWARAIENIAFTATCQNVFTPSDLGLAMICSPEEIMAESIKEGILVADCDLDRIRYLGEQQDTWDFPGVKHCKPGIFRDWCRPELYELALEASQSLKVRV